MGACLGLVGIASVLLAPVHARSAPRVDSQDRARCAVVAVGDVNGDGHGDFALAHRVRPFRADQTRSELPAIQHRPILWVLSGADGKVLSAIKGRGFRELAYRRRRHVVSFWGNRAPSKGGFGYSFAACGDLDGRPGAELLIDTGDFRRPGEVLVVSSATGEEVGTFQVPGGRVLGRSLDGGEQLIGDPTPDFIVASKTGAWVVDGASLEPRQYLSIDPQGALIRMGASGWSEPGVERQRAGQSGDSYEVHLLPDADGDGLGEIVLGPLATSQESRRLGRQTRVILSGSPTRPLLIGSESWCAIGGFDLDGDGRRDLLATSVDKALSAWSLATGERLWRVGFEGGYRHAEGTGLDWAGDRDGDGVADLWLAANETCMDADIGRIWLRSGATGAELPFTEAGRAQLPKKLRGGGVDACALGDGSGNLAGAYPVARFVGVLGGEDGEFLWRRSIEELETRGRPEDPGHPLGLRATLLTPARVLARAAAWGVIPPSTIFPQDRTVETHSASLRPSLVRVGDVDGDGHDDFVFAHRTAGGMPTTGPAVEQQPCLWVLSSLDGSVLRTVYGEGMDLDRYRAQRSGARVPDPEHGAKGVLGSTLAALGDWDGDGVREVMVGHGARGGGRGIPQLLSPGEGKWLRPVRIPFWLEDTGHGFAGGGQWTGGSAPDLAVATEDGLVLVDGETRRTAELIRETFDGKLRRETTGSLELEGLAADPWRVRRYTDVASVGDLDGDGSRELVFTVRRGGVRFAASDPYVTHVVWSDRSRKPVQLAGRAWNAVAGRDMDGDGHPDLVTAGSNGAVRAWSMRGASMLWEIWPEAGANSPRSTSLAWSEDRDDDGRADLWIDTAEAIPFPKGSVAQLISGKDGQPIPLLGKNPPVRALQAGGVDLCLVGDLNMDGLSEIAVLLPRSREIAMLTAVDRSVLWIRKIEELEVPKPAGR